MIEVQRRKSTSLLADLQILLDINTVFEKGKVNLIIGQSGQGKSVLGQMHGRAA